MKLFHASVRVLLASVVFGSIFVAASLESAAHEQWRGSSWRQHMYRYHSREASAYNNESSELKKAALAQLDLHVRGEPEVASSTLPPAHFYEDAQKVEHYLEKRRGVEFFPEGSRVGVDLGKAALKELREEFSESPDVFEHCVLMRDFATPLRVGSALNTFRRKSLVKTSRQARNKSFPAHNDDHRKTLEALMKKAHYATAKMSNGSIDMKSPKSFVQFESFLSDPEDDGEEDGEEDDGPENAKIKPESGMLFAKGGVMDRDTDTDDAELEVNMFAWLNSVSGEVAVIPNGIIAKWGSKKKVPIAGFLCSHEEGLTLHTLPTPCLETTLDEDGSLQMPPVPLGMLAKRPISTSSSISEGPGVPAPAPASLFQEEADDVFLAVDQTHHRQSDFDSDDSDEELSDTSDELSDMKFTAGPAPQPAQAPVPVTAQAPAGVGSAAKHYHVYVGDVLLHFSTKAKGQRFCHRLAQKIADDLGDTEWTTDRLKQETLAMDMKVGTFVQMMRQPLKVDWTTGSKSVLVVIMDWMRGDKSKSPLSRQTLTPSYYKDTIMPKVAQAFRQMSYGKFTIKPTVIPEVIPYTRLRSRYASHGYPFPGLYDGAKESLEGNIKFGSRYRFDDYDLVYVVNPQQAPAGTKGVAWVSAKGAICNGCEAISENFQVMVAVHELGHNLGLLHASSNSLEYGNPFDWMGNYPDVTGLTYGLSYKYKLHWIPKQAVTVVTDRMLSSLNYRVIMQPFDGPSAPQRGEVVGIKVSLRKNSRDLFVAYRQSAGKEAGVYITLEDRDSANSELIDMGCHSGSQKDARLQPGWTYMDPSGQVVIVVQKVTKRAATLQIFRAPGGSGSAAIRARETFTDGRYKCPRTCIDSDLLVSQFNGCSGLKRGGYCRGGSITMGGKKLSIGTDLCPESCNMCSAALKGSPLVNGKGCADRKMRIDGMNCRQIAVGGYCDASTNVGHVGRDLCPASCGNCPPRPSFATSFAQTDDGFSDPTPERTLGSSRGAQTQPEASGPLPQEEDDDESADTVVEDPKNRKCQDDPDWQDADGDGCYLYRKYIKAGEISREDACNYKGGEAKRTCRVTCKTCTEEATNTPTCQDKSCISKWKAETGQCFRCSTWAARCNESHVMEDCPLTCGMCTKDPTPADDQGKLDKKADGKPCKDSLCIDGWMARFGKCYKCEDYAKDYCGRDADVMRACPSSCNLCDSASLNTNKGCANDFRDQICQEYHRWGWCSHREIQLHCRSACDLCGEKGANVFANPWEEELDDDDDAGQEGAENGDAAQHGKAASKEVSVFVLVLLLGAMAMQVIC